jgi:16S rRNA (guanine527-N7)-methyltransferase
MIDIICEYYDALVVGLLPNSVRLAVTRHHQLLQEWSKTVKLIGTATESEAAESLYLDSLMSAVILSQAFEGKKVVHDVGSGAGFPGLFLHLYFRHDVSFTLHEVRRRKASFLKTAAREMDIANLRVDNSLVNPYAFNADAVLSRATYPPSDWLSLAETLVVPGGRVALFLAEESAYSAEAPVSAGALTRVNSRDYTLPITGRRRAIVIYEARR